MEVTRECNNYKKTLLPDETVEWSGRPQKTTLLSPETKKGLLTRWGICVILLAVLTFLYAFFSLRAETEFQPLVVIVLVVVLGWTCLVPVKDWLATQKKVSYYVTNKRFILVSGSTVYALNRNGTNTEVVGAEGDAIHVLFGTCVGIPGKKYIRFAVQPEIDDNNHSKNGFVFYAVKEGKSDLEQLLFHS